MLAVAVIAAAAIIVSLILWEGSRESDATLSATLFGGQSLAMSGAGGLAHQPADFLVMLTTDASTTIRITNVQLIAVPGFPTPTLSHAALVATSDGPTLTAMAHRTTSFGSTTQDAIAEVTITGPLAGRWEHHIVPEHRDAGALGVDCVRASSRTKASACPSFS